MNRTWHQPDGRPTFDDAEFYVDGPVVTVALDDRFVTVQRDGQSRLEVDDEVIRTPEQFRRAFPDGEMPVDDERHRWENNGWFDLYSAPAQGENGHLDRLSYSLAEAIADAEDLVRKDAMR